jgi:hypothetical protein
MPGSSEHAGRSSRTTRVKTAKIDAAQLPRSLRVEGAERCPCPSVEEEDDRRPRRESDRLIAERVLRP